MNRDHKNLSKSERRLYWISGGAIVFLAASAGIWQWLHATPQIDIPAPKIPEPNGYDFFIAAGQAYVPPNPLIAFTLAETMQHPEFPEPPPGSPKMYSTLEKEAWLRRNKKALSLLRQGLRYPALHPPVKPNRADWISLPHARFRDLGDVLRVESKAKAERGDWKGAANSILDAVNFSYEIQRGGSLAANTYGTIIRATSLPELQDISLRLDAPTIGEITAKLGHLNAKAFPLSAILEQEKWMGQVNLKGAMNEKTWRLDIFHPSIPTSSSQRIEMLFISKRQVLENYTKAMDAQIANAERPYTQTQPVPLGDYFTGLLLSDYQSARMYWAKSETRYTLAMTMLALHAYKLEKGRYPQKLDELTPEYLKQVPTDPFGSGEPMRYRLENQNYTLWSIGPDGIDDHGKPIVDPSIPTEEGERFRYMVMPDSKGDVVADVNFP